MKKYIGLMIVILLSTHKVSANYCANGFGNSFTAINGQTYCYSRTSMNWWSALAWCHANGMEIVHPDKDCICTGHEGCEIGLDCSNLKRLTFNGNLWTSVPSSSDHSYVVVSSGNLAAQRRRDRGIAVCK